MKSRAFKHSPERGDVRWPENFGKNCRTQHEPAGGESRYMSDDLPTVSAICGRDRPSAAEFMLRLASHALMLPARMSAAVSMPQPMLSAATACGICSTSKRAMKAIR